MRILEYFIVLAKSILFLGVCAAVLWAGPLLTYYRLSGKTYSQLENVPLFEDPRTYIVVVGFLVFAWIMISIYQGKGAWGKVAKWIFKTW